MHDEGGNNDKFLELEFNLGNVIRAIRKHTGMNQTEASKILGINQSTYSKVERGRVSTGVENWLQFANKLNINFDAPLTNSVDFGYECSYSADDGQGSKIKLPKRYGNNRNVSCRVIGPFIYYLKQFGHGKRVNDFFSSLNIDSDFFMISHNTISILFVIDLLKNVQLSSETLNVKEILGSSAFKRLISLHSRKFPNHMEFIKYFTNNSKKFDSIFNYTLETIGPKKVKIIMTLDKSADVEADRKTIQLYKEIIIGVFSKILTEINPEIQLLTDLKNDIIEIEMC